MTGGAVLWITGLSGAGKTTLALQVAARLAAAGRPVIRLDGDALRAVLGGDDAAQSQGYGRQARLDLAFRYARLCHLLATQGATVVIATISLFHEIHRWNREHLPGYVEIYLRAPIALLRARDPNGLYARFDRGLVRDVAGLDLAVDEPQTADVVFDADGGIDCAGMADILMRHVRAAAA